jgi:hypothetical protein
MTAIGCGVTADIIAMADNRRESELFRAAQYDIDRHKWYLSERAGHDLGQAAIRNWKCTHWWRWCRERLIEHLSGTKYWSELDQKDYGLINRDFHPNRELAQVIVSKIKNGGENLDIIFWAQDTGQKMKDVIEILNLLDINSRRVSFWAES